MSTEVKVPALGESITSGILVTWLVKEGDYVNKGDLLYELETDKITSEAPAEVAGTISLLAKEGDEVDIGQAVASIDESTTPPDSSDSPVEASPKVEENTSASSSKGTSEELMPLSPAVRKLVDEHGLDPAAIKGTGKGGRLIKADVLSAIDSNSAPPSSEPVKEPHLESNIIQDGRTTRTKLSPIRRKIAQRLVNAQQQAALLTTFNEVDLSEVMALRKKHQEAFVARHGIKLGFMSFFVKAVVHGLQAVPEVNAQIDGDDLVQNHYYDIGVAVGTERGWSYQ